MKFERGSYYYGSNGKVYLAHTDELLLDMNRLLVDPRNKRNMSGYVIKDIGGGVFVEKYFSKVYGVSTVVEELSSELGRLTFMKINKIEKKSIPLNW